MVKISYVINHVTPKCLLIPECFKILQLKLWTVKEKLSFVLGDTFLSIALGHFSSQLRTNSLQDTLTVDISN